MKCRWCDGTGAECGCGRGFCEHCMGWGVATDPPYGVELDESIFGEPVFRSCVDAFGRELHGEDYVRFVVGQCGKELFPYMIRAWAEYWRDDRRGDTLGDYTARIIKFCREVELEKCTEEHLDRIKLERRRARMSRKE